MAYELLHDRVENNRRVKTFRNTMPGVNSETKIYPIYQTQDGKQWWGFVDLFQIPYARMVYAKHVTDLYNIGLSLKDIIDWCTEEKALLKSDDPEKYEKLYSLTMQKENIARNTADPVRQHLALCTVYVLAEEEAVDSFNDQMAEEKMKLWGADLNAVSFFLNWHNDHMQRYIKGLNKTSQTVSALSSVAKSKKSASSKG